MSILLDTHFLIELVNKQSADGFSEEDMFEQAVGNSSFKVSLVSLWEVEIKFRIGKLHITCPLSEWTSIVMSAGGLVIPITEDHILADIGPEVGTRDPFDRLLVSTAAAENCKLLTRDHRLLSHPSAWKSISP